MIQGIKHVTVPVKDQTRALAFYTQKLGFIVTTDAPMGPGQRWIELQLPDSSTYLVLFTAPGQEDRIGTPSNIIFTCSDVRKTHAQLAAQGVSFTQPPTEEPWGTYALFEDSEGNTFCLSAS